MKHLFIDTTLFDYIVVSYLNIAFNFISFCAVGQVLLIKKRTVTVGCIVILKLLFFYTNT